MLNNGNFVVILPAIASALGILNYKKQIHSHTHYMFEKSWTCNALVSDHPGQKPSLSPSDICGQLTHHLRLAANEHGCGLLKVYDNTHALFSVTSILFCSHESRRTSCCLLQVDWSEPWLWFLVGFHLVCSLFTMITVVFNCHNIQIALFLLFREFTMLHSHIYIMLMLEMCTLMFHKCCICHRI